MPAPLLHRHEETFDERNEFLHAVLGLISISRQLGGLLLDGAAPAEPEQLGGAEAHCARQELLDALLGVLALERQFMVLIRTARAQSEAPRPRAARPLAERGPGLLR